MIKRAAQKVTNKKSQTPVKYWMEETYLVDIWWFQHPDPHVYTWFRKKTSPFVLSIRFFLVSYGITENMISSYISPGYRSNHSLISVNFIPNVSDRGKGFWKLNCSHLKNRIYKTYEKNYWWYCDNKYKCKSKPTMGCSEDSNKGWIHEIWRKV